MYAILFNYSYIAAAILCIIFLILTYFYETE